MIKLLLVKFIRKYKNPLFTFHENISSRVIMELTFNKLFALLRSFKLIIRGKFVFPLFIGKRVQFFNLSNIVFGKGIILDDSVYLSALGTEAIVIGNGVHIGAYSRVIISTTYHDPGKGIKIGNNVGIGEFACIGGAGGVVIGDDCIIGAYFSLHPENHNFLDNNKLIKQQGVSRKGIKIGKNCWIGAKVTILDGVSIGNNCVIAAGAVVNSSFPDYSVIGGVPAKLLKTTLPK
ncbi:MAG: acyltransferase [Bacteroidales bacterium]|nr:acyltransferase [Bacteroidales bacterium]